MNSRKNRCPICGATTLPAHKPFCSKHCSDEDLGRWLGGRYRIPGERATDEEMAAAGGLENEGGDS